jgi:hypothetical protein
VKNLGQRSNLRPQTTIAIHPRAKHGAFWLFHVKCKVDLTTIREKKGSLVLNEEPFICAPGVYEKEEDLLQIGLVFNKW